MVKKVKKDDDCGTLQKLYFRSHGDDRTKAWEKMSFFCQPYTWVRHKLRKTHKMFRPDRTGCYVDSKNKVVCNDPNPTNKDIIWLTKEQSDYYKNPVLPDPSTAERKHSKAETLAESKFVDDETRAESKFVDDEYNPLAENAESKSGDARNHLDELQWAEHPGTKSGWGEPNHSDEFNRWAEFQWAEHLGTKSGIAWADPKHSDRKFSGINEWESSHKPVYIHIKKYGILSGNPADKNIVIVDPAGGPFLSNNSEGALGASKSIYNYLGYPKFPPKLLSGFKPFDARYHEYDSKVGKVRVIHTIGPNGAKIAMHKFDAFMLPGLTQTYENVFKEFIKCGKNTLRLLLVSGGIYSGENDISAVTYEAISAAVQKLSSQDQVTLGKRNIEMCLFDSDEEVYEDHKKLCSSFKLCPAAGGRKTLKRRRSPRSSPPRSGRSRTRSRSRF